MADDIPAHLKAQPMNALIRSGAASCLTLAAGFAAAVDAFEQAPIAYSQTKPSNAVATLDERLGSGVCELAFEPATGYLRSLLKALVVPVSSQTLVFSKTSLQQQRISPRNPRAVYFNDEVYVGYVRGGDVLEVSVADPRLGTVFYTLDQTPDRPPRFVRQTDSCLVCHGGSQTRGVPGHVVRSLYPDSSGQPIFSAGSHRVDDTTPLADRWGGWYVSGRHGGSTHLGNITYRRRPEPGEARDESGLNQTDLAGRFDAAGYLSPHSDLVALSVLAHQATAHTILAKASFESRMALHREAALNLELGEPADHRWPSTTTVLAAAADSLVACFLFSGAAALPEPIAGTTAFAAEFASAGPTDRDGRSLRTLDLQTRLLRHPCSFLIYSPSFDALPGELRRRFWERMDAVLARGEDREAFAHLSEEDRDMIRTILAATKPGAPPHWAVR